MEARNNTYEGKKQKRSKEETFCHLLAYIFMQSWLKMLCALINLNIEYIHLLENNTIDNNRINTISREDP